MSIHQSRAVLLLQPLLVSTAAICQSSAFHFLNISTMSFFQDATHVTVTGGTLVAAAAGSTFTINKGSSAFKDLSASAAHTALHNSSARFDAPRCHRNTRTSYLNALKRWILGHGDESADVRLIWLTGGAGAGKSAIMQSIVECCAQDAVILGTFFFSRADPSRNYAEVLIPTLAYQLASAFPAAMTVLEPTIQRNPLIFKTSLQTQAYELLVRPLLYLIETGVIDTTSSLRRVFVIDGLDECDDPRKQALIIHAIADILSDNLGPICVLIASRPEVAISRAFQRETSLHSILAKITLDDNDEASSDIRQFIEDSFLDILDSHPLRTNIPSNWPSPHSVDELVGKASGHFIYAATAMRFISSTDEHPARALQVVEGLEPSRAGNPFAELDALYLHILTSAKYSSQVLGILRHCIFSNLENTVTMVCFMYPHISPEDVALFLSDIQALISLDLPPNNEAEMEIILKHASLGDFLMDAKRSQAIYMSGEEYRAFCLPRYFWLLDNATSPQVRRSLQSCGRYLIGELVSAISHSHDIELLWSLISGHSPQDVWNYYAKYWQHVADPLPLERIVVIPGVCSYVYAIRESAANHDNTLYIHQFKILIQLLLDDVDELVQTHPQYSIIPALMFSSSPWCLTVLVYLLHYHFLTSLEISDSYMPYFLSLQRIGFPDGGIDPRSFEAIKCLPQSQSYWVSDLATGLEVILQHLLGYSWTPESLHPNPHQRWLRKMKPLKYLSHGSPKLSSTVYSYLCRLPTPKVGESSRKFTSLRCCGYSFHRADIIWKRRVQCFTLLQTVISHLHKSDRTSELAKLARKSLPKAALWFPRLMKRARAEMDAYVLRWEESPEGLLEKAQSLSINDID
ncbi:hypothetical protein D9619_004939 [Psilocybe cf. subviscida]|uniref:Nephrocystin 3-like N-terminal domain-containing protein n=1 Tax=Psilocybe cf. subviscida TaxID=2480587 RepID=A0A8H5F852_9AGAR|nr:hypothetical protein D9619_004939 [Psilocybe cf. subviscida]